MVKLVAWRTVEQIPAANELWGLSLIGKEVKDVFRHLNLFEHVKKIVANGVSPPAAGQN